VIKVEQWPTLMGMKRLALNWCFTPRIEGGGRGDCCEMRCGTRGSGSMAGEARAALGGGARPTAVVIALFSMGRKKKVSSAGWAKRPSRPVGRLGRLAQKLKEFPFQNKNWNFEFTKALENCTRRFRNNFDTRIFPKFF
jgi:hypothetical protein